MAARMRHEAGFSMVELLVVIVIIGVLAALAVPLYLSQQAKAQDSVVRQDLETMAQFVRGALEHEPDMPTITWSGDKYSINGEAAGTLSPGVVFGGLSGTDMYDWCIDMTHPAGKIASVDGFKYSAEHGLETGSC